MAEYARKICKRLHAYLRMEKPYRGTVRTIAPYALRLETDIGVVSVLSNTNCLHPFSITVNSTKPFTETDLFEGETVLLRDEQLLFDESELVIDVSQATDIELSVDVMRTLFLPLDLNLRIRHLLRVIEGGTHGFSGESRELSEEYLLAYMRDL